MRTGTIGLGAALLATGLLATACGSGGNDCKKACAKVTKCLTPQSGDGGSTKGDGAVKKDA